MNRTKWRREGDKVALRYSLGVYLEEFRIKVKACI
jgi:hypothetical protein